jgi:hypothetical protein
MSLEEPANIAGKARHHVLQNSGAAIAYNAMRFLWPISH